MYHSENIDQIAEALSIAQSQIEQPKKNKAGHNYRYADLAEVNSSIKEPLANNKLAIVQYIEDEFMVTKLIHASGQWIATKVRILYKSSERVNEMQALGSAITYARRYGICCLLNIAADDDDDAVSTVESGDKGSYSHAARPMDKFITEKQLSWLEKEISDKPDTEKMLLDTFGSLSRIPIKEFDSVIKSVRSKTA